MSGYLTARCAQLIGAVITSVLLRCVRVSGYLTAHCAQLIGAVITSVLRNEVEVNFNFKLTK